MSDFFFFDSGEPLRPPAEVKITELTAEPYTDGLRVKVTIKMTPFQERPNLELYAIKGSGPVVAELSVIETLQHILEFTMHIRGVEDTQGDYTVVAELYYEDRTDPQDKQTTAFSIQAQ